MVMRMCDVMCTLMHPCKRAIALFDSTASGSRRDVLLALVLQFLVGLDLAFNVVHNESVINGRKTKTKNKKGKIT